MRIAPLLLIPLIVCILGTSAVATSEAFKWTTATGFVGLGTDPFETTGARGISDDASVISGRGVSVEDGDRIGTPFVWTPANGIDPLTPLSGYDANGNGIGVSSDGSTIAGVVEDSDGNRQAFKWTSATEMVGLGFLSGGGSNSNAQAVSADGDVIVGLSDSSQGTEAFRWTSAGGMKGLGDLGEDVVSSAALGVSDDGGIVVGSADQHRDRRAFLWDAMNGMRDLESIITMSDETLNGWAIPIAHSISADGSTIVGEGTDPAGVRRGWVFDMATAEFVALPEGTNPFDVSSDGSVVAGRIFPGSSGEHEAFRWTADSGFELLGFLDSSDPTSQAFAITGDGNVLAGVSGSARVIPEPSTIGFLASGLIGLAMWRRKSFGPVRLGTHQCLRRTG